MPPHRRRCRLRPSILLAVGLAACPRPAAPPETADLPPVPPPAAAPARCPDHAPLKRAFFGDLHVHTGWSLDAYTFGSGSLTPADAIAFARGEPIGHPLGGSLRLDRPLDFVAITDHAEFFDVLGACLLDPGNPVYDGTFCRDLRARPIRGLSVLTALNFNLPAGLPDDPTGTARGRALVWRRTQAAANLADEPCVFSTFIGYEWTGGTVSGGAARGNLHRNVLFAGHVVPAEPADARRYPHESDLWRALVEDCRNVPGCDTLVIPHNSNYGKNGSMWDVETPEQAALRADLERLVEIYQHKGDSECANGNLDPQDGAWEQACEFEKISFRAIPDAGLGFSFGSPEDPRPNMVRHGLARGLRYFGESRLNPLELGIIASTDTHNGTSGLVAERDYVGNHGTFWEGTPESRLGEAREHSAGGLAALWAEQNTRAALWAALQRREAWGTSGPRIRLRFYAGDSSAACADPDFPAGLIAAGAVPMGGRLVGSGEAPWFVVHAEADETPLVQIDIVRIRNDDDAEATAVTVAAIPGGAATLCAVWRDGDARPDMASAYYARVFETPTPRWTAWTCRRRPDLCAGPPEMIRERAWSSPIWLYPETPAEPRP